MMSLTDGTSKMSKSDPVEGSRINLTDSPDVIAKKASTAVCAAISTRLSSCVRLPCRSAGTDLELGVLRGWYVVHCQRSYGTAQRGRVAHKSDV